MRIHLSRAATAALVIGIVATGGVHAQTPKELAPGAHAQGTPPALASVAAATQAASVPSASAGPAGESQPTGEAPLRAAVAQAAPSDPRWGLLAELAEHDFFLDAPLGRGQLYAFRWEEPGKMSMVTVVGLFSAKQIFELGEVPGEILLYYADHDKAKQNITHLKVAPDGTVRWGKDKPFLIRGEGESYFFTNHLKLVEAAPDSSAGRKAAKLIASGKLRAANPDLLRTDAASPGVAAPSALASVATTTQAASVPNAPAAVQVTAQFAEGKASALRAQSDERGSLGLLVQDVAAAGAQPPRLQGAYVAAVATSGAAHVAGVIAGDIIVSMDGTQIANAVAMSSAVRQTRVGQQVTLEVIRGNVSTPLRVTLLAQAARPPLRNADRAKPRAGTFSSWGMPTSDPIQVGEMIEALLEPSDSLGGRWGTRVDQYTVEKAPAGRYLKVFVDPASASMSVAVSQPHDQCPGSLPEYERRSTESGTRLGIAFKTGACRSLIELVGKPSDKPYRIFVLDQTPAEIAAFEQAQRDRELAEQRQREAEQENSNGVFRRALGGALMGAMLGGGGQNSIDLAVTGAQTAAQGGNAYEVLNSMGNVAAANAAESERQLNETIRQAQAQGGGGATAATGPTAGVTAAASPSTNPAGAASTPKVVRAYFWVGTTPGPDADHNTFCQSNIMSITVNSKGGFDVYGLAREQLMPLLPTFIEKCSRLSKPEGSGQFFDDGGNGAPLQLNVLRRGDVQVHMP